jgi:circadian clock protein KaiB
MEKPLFKVYVAGRTAKSGRVINALRRMCDEDVNGEYELTVIDILESPELAEQDDVIATPTVVREQPPPHRRIIGGLHNTEEIVIALAS